MDRVNVEVNGRRQHDMHNSRCRRCQRFFVLRGRKAVQEGKVGETDERLEGTNLYTAWVPAPSLVKDAVFAFTRVAIHDGDN